MTRGDFTGKSFCATCGVEAPYRHQGAAECDGSGYTPCRCDGDRCGCCNHGAAECQGCDECTATELGAAPELVARA